VARRREDKEFLEFLEKLEKLFRRCEDCPYKNKREGGG